jgi:hypothetical protein
MIQRLWAALALALSMSLVASTGARAISSVPAEAANAARSSYESWLDRDASRRADVRAFEEFLAAKGVSGVLPTREILLNDTDWSMCRMDGPYSIAAKAYWPNIVNTLRYIRDEIVPTIGPVEVVSGFRDRELNRCAGGAAHSAHAQFYALDLMPKRSIARADLIARVCADHARHGAAYRVGLGFYDHLRFHIDSRSFRRWGPDYHAGSSPCLRAAA